ncbi:MAG: hypothetical protein MJZ16_13485, partial [Bacteroidales bacterium]|nr:hypothetical protein [Bacteroidales bacterium]
MTSNYTWVPIYKELAQKLLLYRNKRRELVEWIYSTFDSNDSKKSLIGYLHEADGSRISDIDPFSVFAMFNRGTSTENRIDFLSKFKDYMSLTSELPVDFDGIPMMNAMRSFFFKWNDPQSTQIEILWELFAKAMSGISFEDEYNTTIKRNGIKYSLTMALFWILPDNYLALDSNNRSYLNRFGFDISETPDYNSYMSILEGVKEKITSGEMPSKNFIELSAEAWANSSEDGTDISTNNKRKVWLWLGDHDTFLRDRIKVGNTVSKEVPDFSIFQNKIELRAACQKAQRNTDVSISNAYWQFMKEVSVGDIIVVFKNKRVNRKNTHLMYGWGVFTSDIIHVPGDDSPIQRSVQWHLPYPSHLVEDHMLNNSLFFHPADDRQAENIISLLGIDGSNTENRKYWLAGYAFGSTNSQLERFLSEGIWEGGSDDKTNSLIQSMQKDDVIILKSTSTKGKKHDIPFMRVKALGIITSDCQQLSNRDYRFAVNYIPVEETDFEGSVYGKYRKTLHLCD